MQSDSRHDPPGSCRLSACPGVPAGGSLEVVDDRTVTCDACGRQSPVAETLTWTTSVENGRRLGFCEECSRTHLRAIEGKLDSAWW